MGYFGKAKDDQSPFLGLKKPKGTKRVVMVELCAATPNLGRFIVTPTFGMLAVASVLAERSKYEVILIFERYVGRVTPEDVLAMEPFVVMTNGLTTAAPENEAFFERFRELSSGTIPVVAGGEHASMYPDDAKKYADYILMYEGDDSVFPLLSALEQADPSFRDAGLRRVPGLHYRDASGKWTFNDTAARVDSIDHHFDFSIMPGARGAGSRFRAARIPLQTSRGCRFSCSFCSWISLYGKTGYRLRPPKDIVQDVLHAIDYVGTNEFFVVDNLFAGDVDHVEETMGRLAEAFKDRPRKPSLTALMRADQLDGGPDSLSEKMVATLARGGLSIVSFGLESLSERSLLQMRKRMTLQKYLAASATLRRHGISMLGTFAAGFDGDTLEDVHEIADFAEKMGLFTVQVYSRCITPGTTDMILSGNRIIPGRPNRYANGHGVWVLPSLMMPSQLQEAMFEVSLRFHKRAASRKPAHLIFGKIWRAMQPNFLALQRIEREVLLPMGIYRAAGDQYRLDEDRLDQVCDDGDLGNHYRSECRRIFTEEVENVFATAAGKKEFEFPVPHELRSGIR